MENSKYYTPEKEEFHIGFEYFVRVTKDDDLWVKCTLLADNIDVNYDRIVNSPEMIKVKCLDREDIESLGWVLANELFYFDLKGVIEKDSEYFLGAHFVPFPDYEMRFSVDDSHLIILDFNRDIVFQGTIKNKSELRRLMKQLNITK